MNLNDYLKKALEENWATGHFNASESDQFRAIAEAAKDLNTIAIIGTSEGEAKHLGYFEAVALRDAFRKELGEYAKNFHISVEGELGYLRGESKIEKEKITVKPEDLTNPDTAEDFVLSTGVNRLAISVGNIHGISMDEPALDIERIKKIREAVPKNVALVLHGGSGIPDKQIKAAIAVGIANIHINTDIRVAYTEALREEFSKNSEEVVPYKLDTTAREAVKKIVKEKLILFGAKNRI